MRLIHTSLFCSALLLAACSGEPSAENAILGTWLQETPTSTTAAGLQTTTTDTVLKLQKTGKTHLTRNLDIVGPGLPRDGVKIRVELRGDWKIENGQLKQTQDTTLIIPREANKITQDWADQLQTQASEAQTSVKDIILVDKTQLIVQDTNSGITDIYRRK